MFVISQDVIRVPMIEIGQGSATLADFEKFQRQTGAATAPHTLQAFFRGFADGGGNAFAGQGGKFANRSFGGGIFDVQSHLCTKEEFFFQ